MENLYIQKGEEKLLKLQGELEAVGMDWAEAQSLWEQLRDLKEVILSGAMPEEGTFSERKNIALSSDVYRQHIMAISAAKQDALEKEVKYKAVKSQINAIRTILSNKREMLKHGVE